MGKNIAKTALFTALSLITFLIEAILPPILPIAGAKLGLANVFVLLALLLLGEKEALVVLLGRTLLGSIFSGNPMSLLYSLSGGLVSLFSAVLLVRFASNRISVTAISVVSAVLHNLMQTLVASLLVGTKELLFYAPVLILAGVLAGTVTGLAAYFVLRIFISRKKNAEISRSQS